MSMNYTVSYNGTHTETYSNKGEAYERFAEIAENAKEHGIIFCDMYEGDNRICSFGFK